MECRAQQVVDAKSMFADRLKGMGEILGVLQCAFGWSFSSAVWEGSNSEPPSCRRSLWGVCNAALQKAFLARESFFQELAPSEHSTLLAGTWLVGRTLVLKHLMPHVFLCLYFSLERPHGIEFTQVALQGDAVILYRVMQNVGLSWVG